MSVYYAYLVSHFPPEVNQRGLTDLGYYDETCYYETPGGHLYLKLDIIRVKKFTRN